MSLNTRFDDNQVLVASLATERGSKVAVAMSGGVDSAVAAALLVEQGYDVVGLTMNLWPAWVPDPDDAFRGCCGIGAIDDARAVARKIGIRHFVLNMREEFERAVIDYFCDEYALGRTPNPCIACNKAIKFSLLLTKTKAMGLDWLATGHYARIRIGANESRVLLRGKDETKDQSYVLYGLRQDQLRRLLLPIGDYTKAEIRDHARRFDLPVADKPDSQEICFIPRGHYSDLVAARRPQAARPGPILDGDGRQVGMHRGIAHFTVGQRRGLGVAVGRPLYVADIDPSRNAIVVAEEDDLLAVDVEATEVNWVAGEAPAQPLRVTARVRHAAGEVGALAWMEHGRLRVCFEEPQRAAARGQAVALYEGDVMLGGGVIEHVHLQKKEAVCCG